MKTDAIERSTPILQVSGLGMRFGGVDALQGIGYEVVPGIIQAVIGPNGAGKTTLFNCISGVLAPSEGGIRFEGRQIQGLAPHRIAELGISRTFQHVALFKRMTVLENVMLARHPRTRCGFLATGFRFPGMRSEETRITEESARISRFCSARRLCRTCSGNPTPRETEDPGNCARARNRASPGASR